MKHNLLLVLLLTFTICSDIWGQSFIQIRNKSLSEEISTNFTYNVTGGSAYTLSDRPDAVNVIFHLSGDDDGGLFAIANATDSWSVNPGNIYYRPSGSSLWQNTGAAALKVQGGSNGGYISLVRSSESATEHANTADQIRYRLNSGSAESDITLNLAGQEFMTVAHNYDDMLYVLVRTADGIGTIYKKSVSGTIWESTGITGVQSLTAIPNSNRVVYASYVTPNINFLFAADNDNTNVVNQGNPIPLWDADKIEEIAVTYNESGQMELWALSVALIYKSVAPGTWTEEDGINDMRKLTSTGGKILATVLLDDASENIPYRIFTRAQDGVYLDDERVQTNFNSNSVNIAVAPGTYTITQNPVTGWHITDIRVNEATAAGTTTSLAGPSATVTVSAGEVVVVEFENQFTTTTNIGQTCGTNFVEDFSSYKNGDWGNPLEGLISYHKATGNFGYGYYAVVSSTDVMSYGDTIYDHTSGDASGSMLLVDATFEKGIFYRRRFTGLLAGARYSFGAWITNFNPPAGDKPNVSFEIYNTSGVLLTSVSSGDVLTSQWQNFTTVFDSDGSDIELVLRNNTPRTRGNDLAIDDISFGLSIPEANANAVFDCASGTGTVTVLSPVSAGNAGDFEYSLDGLAWQTGTVFAGVAPGSYTMTVRYTNAPAGSCESSVALDVTSSCISISGNIWQDANGNVGQDAGELAVSGNDTDNNGGSSTVTGEDIFANLVGSDGKVVASQQIISAGTYAFVNVPAGISYQIVLSTAANAPGQDLAVGSIPAGWLLTGSSDPVNGVNNANSGIVIDLGVVTTSISDVDFGMQQPPVADAKAFVVPNSAFSATPPATYPALAGYQAIAASSSSLTGYPTGGSLSGGDPEDCAGAGTCSTGTGTTFHIETVNANTTLYYDFGAGPVLIDLTGGPVTITDFDVSKLVIYGQTGAGTVSNPIGFTYSITDNAGVTSVAVPYTIQTQSPLPVTLISFDANQEGVVVNLKWVTSSEKNSKGFEIERSSNAKLWTKIGFLRSRGENSNRKLTYNFTDATPGKGTTYYRLRMLDHDGTFAYSAIRSTHADANNKKLVVYPNPVVNGKLTIDVPPSGASGAEVYNLAGIKMLDHNFGKGNDLDVSNFQAGVYILRVVSENGNRTSTFVIK
ncbi:Por secretion system C-terminal sorting domain-containing protein [Dyadobacter sp. SG02]|uniref:T9SS type A sorting domain-containing protein n=1 Tax=Dyadobacter sp. SG02 TaxID=1855291 RepID=UPI0008C6B07B|nr:T9SS type A sorting domain-containing protein [Dyadobacter sp. SG02]SEJ85994.1 Por secretion system C-terminal sorting domain-containing protein [Dyadobacter sp. SG02]